jgi:signal transduction histidine kinase
MRDDEKRSKFVELEKAAKLLKDRCFEKIEDCIFPANYEIRGLEVFDLFGQHFLSYGDKSGLLQVYNVKNMATNKPVIKENLKGIIDILSFKEMPGNQGLLFVGVRFKGMYVYLFSVENGEVIHKPMLTVFEENKFISFFFPNIVFDKKGNPVRFEVWICFDDGNFQIYTGSFPGEQWKGKEPCQLSYVLESYTIDRNERIGAPGLFMGNSAGDIFYLPFSEEEVIDFPGDLNKHRILNIHGAVIEAMIPMSDYRRLSAEKTRGEFFYPEYCGCLVKLNNKIICVYFDKKKDPPQAFTLTKVFPNRLLAIKCLSFSDCCYTVVSDIENKLHLVKNITDMEPAGKNIEVIFDGEDHTIVFADRICKFCFILIPPPSKNANNRNDQIEYRAYLGMGNHRVLPVNIYDYDAKLKEAEKLFLDLYGTGLLDIDKAIADPDKEKILVTVEEILERFRYAASRTAVKQLILQLLVGFAEKYCKDDPDFLIRNKDKFSRIFYKIIENEEPGLVIKASDFLTRVEQSCKLSPGVITELQVHVRKFILDEKSYSIKSKNIKRLVNHNETCGNLLDALVYRGILYDRQYDVVFHIDFEESDGEITRILPFSEAKAMVCTSTGNVFLVDIETQEKRLVLQYNLDRQTGDTLKKIDNIYMGKNRIYLLMHDQTIAIFDANELLNNFQENTTRPIKAEKQISIPYPGEKTEGIIYGTSVCQMPQHEEKEDECLVGTNKGVILHIMPTGNAAVLYHDIDDTYDILDLRSFQAGSRFFFAAGYWNGIVKVFEYFPGREKDQIELLYKIPVDNNAVNRLYVFYDRTPYSQSPLVVAGTESGRCCGIHLRFDRSEKDNIPYVYEWCYRCKKAVKSIHPLNLPDDRYYILVASMDNHLHALERNGISINTIHLEFPFIQFYIQKLNTGSNPGNIAGYITTPNNKFQKIHFYFKKDIMKEIDDCFSGNRNGYEELGNKDKESLLLKFKSIGINEDHFKIRYYLRSEHFNSPGYILDEIEELFESGDCKFEEKNPALKALIQRLFCKCFDKLLKDEENFKRTKIFFKRTIDQWDYEGSKNNLKAQLYWIRSMLKGCKDSGKPVDTFNRWFKKSQETAVKSEMKEVDPAYIVQHFVIHPIPFFRVKALQYIHRYITSPMDSLKEEEKTNWEPGLVNALSGSVLKVLKMSRMSDNEAPLWFELETGRFLTWMVVNYKYTGLCPAKLCWDLWQNEISSLFFSSISQAIMIYPGEVKGREIISNMFQAAGNLDKENPQSGDVFHELNKFCDDHYKVFFAKEDQKSKCIMPDLRREFITFFTSTYNFLLYQKVDDFRDTNRLEEITTCKESSFFKSIPQVLNSFYDLSRYIKDYYHEKFEDIYTYPLGKLKYETFYNIRKSINRLEETILNLKTKKQGLELEQKLYLDVLNQWKNFIKHEVDDELILDFANAIKVYNESCIDEHKLMDMPFIFRNIFTRLNIMAECDESYLVYMTKESKEIGIIYNNKEEEASLSAADVKKNPAAYSIPPGWLDPQIFSYLTDSDITRQFENRKSIHMLLKVPEPEPASTSAVYLFFWNTEDTNGLSRLLSREILGEFLTTMAYLQHALLKQRERQEEFFRIVSHELNQMIGGLLTWISNLKTGLMENKPEMRMEYYNRFQYSLRSAGHIIKSILSFRDIVRFDLKLCKIDKELEETVKLARIQYKDYGNVQLDLNINQGDYEIITDPALVATAVMNLLTNARKYNPGYKSVELKLFQEGTKIIIEVKDRGVGIPRNEFGIIFKKFERGAYPRKHKIDGLGIGLASSKNNIELLGGSITFQSQENKETVFRITLNKTKFKEAHMLVTKVEVKKLPAFNLIEDFSLRQKIEEKLAYDPYRQTLTLRGVLSEEEYRALVKSYEKDEKTVDFNRKAVEKLYRESLEKLNKIQLDKQ